MPVRLAPDADAVVIDVGPISTRIGLAGSESFTNSSALPFDAEPTEAALRVLCEEAGIDLIGRPVCVTESIEQRHGPRASRERWATLLFEQFSVHSMYLLLQPACALFGCGLTTGLVVDVKNVIPIYEGYALSHAVKRLDNSVSVAKTAYESVFACDCDIWGDLLTHVVLCGRDSEISVAMVASLQTELTTAVAGSHPGGRLLAQSVSVRAADHGEADAWHGACLFAAFEAGTGQWIRRDDYDARGAAIVHERD